MDALDVGSLLVDAAAFAVLVLVLGVLALTAAATMVVLRLRRRWRDFRGLPRGRRTARAVPAGSALGDSAVTAGAVAATSRLTSLHWWSTQQARRRMWRAVTSASHSVKVARRSGAPIGDLPTVVRQLELAARSADALARADADSPRGSRVGIVEVRRVEEAAAQVHQAALHSLRSIATAEVDPLLPVARLEVAALAAGVRAAAASRRSW